MKPELFDKWVANLVSGEYEQGKGSLRYESHGGFRYCCLGVLYETAGGTWDRVHPQYPYGSPEIAQDGYLDYVLCKEYGLPLPIMREAADRNDGIGAYDRHSFADIAKWLRSIRAKICDELPH